MRARSAGSSGEAGALGRRRGRLVAVALGLTAGCTLAFPVDDRFLSQGAGAGADGGDVVLADGAVLLGDGAVVQPDGAILVGCPESFKACGGRCVSIDDPAFGCTATACDPCPAADTANMVCEGTACKVQSCTGGRLDCDHDPTNGCEVDPNSDPTQCGGCANPPPNAPAGVECCSGTCSLGQCAAETGVFTLVPQLDRPSDLLVDPDERAAYYATLQSGVGQIVRWDAVTKTSKIIADNLGFVNSMALFGADEIVFADEAVGRIARVKRDGTSPQPLTIAGGFKSPRAIAVDGTSVYWAQGTLAVTYEGNIYTDDLASDAGAREFLPGQPDVHSMAAFKGRLAFGLEVPNTVRLREADGGIHEATNEQRPHAVQFVGDDVYWADRATSDVRRFPNGGTGAAAGVANPGYGLGALGHRGNRIFYADMKDSSTNASVFSAALDGSDAHALVSGGLPGPVRLAATKSCLYILAEGHRDTTGAFQLIANTGGLFRVRWTP